MTDIPQTTCPFCGAIVPIVQGHADTNHDPVCQRLRAQHPNASRGEAPANVACLTKVIDRWDRPTWVLVNELDRPLDKTKMLRMYHKDGRPRFYPPSKGQTRGFRMLILRENLKNVGAI
jgi:hypothetical protein